MAEQTPDEWLLAEYERTAEKNRQKIYPACLRTSMSGEATWPNPIAEYDLAMAARWSRDVGYRRLMTQPDEQEEAA